METCGIYNSGGGGGTFLTVQRYSQGVCNSEVLLPDTYSEDWIGFQAAFTLLVLIGRVIVSLRPVVATVTGPLDVGSSTMLRRPSLSGSTKKTSSGSSPCRRELTSEPSSRG